MHGELRRLLFFERQRIAAKAIGDVDELIVVDAARLFDDDERARVLERRLNQQRRGLARRVFLLVERDGRGGRWRPLEGHGRIAADEKVDADLLAPADAVVSFELHDIDASVLRLQLHRPRLLRALHLALQQRFVLNLRHIFGGALREIGGLQGRNPIAPDEAQRHVQSFDGLALAVDGDEFRRDGAGPRDIARRLDAKHEGRHGDHILHIAHLDAVVAGHGGLDRIAARLRRRLDGGVETHARGAAGVGALIALEHGGRFELGVAGKARVGRKQKTLAPRRREHIRKLRRAPFDRTIGREPAGEIARQEIDVEFAVERNHLRRVQQDLEGRQAIGFLLERKVSAREVFRRGGGRGLLVAVLRLLVVFRLVRRVRVLGRLCRLRLRLHPGGFVFDRIIPGRRRLRVEFMIETAGGVGLDRDAPLLIAGTGDDERSP